MTNYYNDKYEVYKSTPLSKVLIREYRKLLNESLIIASIGVSVSIITLTTIVLNLLGF